MKKTSAAFTDCFLNEFPWSGTLFVIVVGVGFALDADQSPSLETHRLPTFVLNQCDCLQLGCPQIVRIQITVDVGAPKVSEVVGADLRGSFQADEKIFS